MADGRLQQSAGERENRQKSVYWPALCEQPDTVQHDQSCIAEPAELLLPAAELRSAQPARWQLVREFAENQRLQCCGRSRRSLLQRAGHRFRAVELSPRADPWPAWPAAPRRILHAAA